MLGPVGGGLQRDVGHPLHRDVAGRVRVRASVRAAEALLRSHLSVQLIPHQDPARDQVELLLTDPLVVVADGCQAMIDEAISSDVHDLAAVVQRAQLIEGGKRGACVRRLVPECPIELGGVPDRLVNSEEQVARIDDQVVVASLDRRRGDLGSQQLRHLGHLGVEVPAVAGEVLPATPGRRSHTSHCRETMITNADRGQMSLDPDPLLSGAGAREVGEVLVLVDVAEHGVGVADARRARAALR